MHSLWNQWILSQNCESSCNLTENYTFEKHSSYDFWTRRSRQVKLILSDKKVYSRRNWCNVTNLLTGTRNQFKHLQRYKVSRSSRRQVAAKPRLARYYSSSRQSWSLLNLYSTSHITTLLPRRGNKGNKTQARTQHNERAEAPTRLDEPHRAKRKSQKHTWIKKTIEKTQSRLHARWWNWHKTSRDKTRQDGSVPNQIAHERRHTKDKSYDTQYKKITETQKITDARRPSKKIGEEVMADEEQR